MRLSGYTSSDIDRALLCDTTLQSGQSENIASLRLKKDGTFYSNSRVISDEKIEEMINLVDEKVKSAADKIFSGDFVINTKQINNPVFLLWKLHQHIFPQMLFEYGFSKGCLVLILYYMPCQNGLSHSIH